MTTETGAPAAAETAAPAIQGEELTIEQALGMIESGAVDQRVEDEDGSVAKKSTDNTRQPAERARHRESEPEPATAEQESTSQEEDADPETDPSKDEPDTDDPEADKLPPIERPRSWAKELDEEWASYPREAQERIAKREQERDTAIRRSQNEAAEARKAAEAVQQAAEQARKDYEAKLPALMRELDSVNQATFADIKTMDDVVKLQAEDPFRFQAWQVHQMRLQAANQESARIEAVKAQERQARRANYEAEQHKVLVELVPEMDNPKSAAELRERAVKMLTDDLGLKNDQLTRWFADDTGYEILQNAGIQKLIADGLKYRDLLNAPKAVAAKPVPPVQKPGNASRQSGDATIQALENRLNKTGSLDDAFALYEARERARSRRAS